MHKCKIVKGGLLMIALFAGLYGQAQKRPLQIEDFDQWKSIRNAQISPDGAFVGYLLHPQVGDNTLVLHNRAKGTTDSFERVGKYHIMANNRFVVMQIIRAHEKTRELKRNEVPKEKWSNDSLVVWDLDKGRIHVARANINGYQVPNAFGHTLAYGMLPDPNDTTVETPKEPGKTFPLLLHDLGSGADTVFPAVKKYQLTEGGDWCYFASDGDSTFTAGIYAYKMEGQQLMKLKTGVYDIAQMTADTATTAMAFVMQTAKADPEHYHLYEWRIDRDDSARVLVDSHSLPPMHRVSSTRRLRYTPSGDRLLFGVTKQQKSFPQDSTILDEEKPKLDIWSHHDKRLQPEQLKELKKDQKRSYLSFFDRRKEAYHILESETLERVRISGKGDGRYALAYDNSPYQKERSWEFPWAKDVYLVDIKKDEKILVIAGDRGRATISPNGEYVLWYNMNDSQWYSYQTKSGKKVCITKDIKVPFYNEDDDHPMDPFSYGTGGWLENDAAVLLYDKYDIWWVDPDGKAQPKNLTQGRNIQSRARLVKTNRERDYWQENESALVMTFNTQSKLATRVVMRLSPDAALPPTMPQPKAFRFITKAASANVYLFTKGSDVDYPDLYVCEQNADGALQKLSNANPQQANYWWYTTELVEYVSGNGDDLQGLLYLPENFDPSKKYPMITYFYEKSSDGLYRYQTPRPSYSTISKSFYTSNGYIVFVPDIVYEPGIPGHSAYNCIVAGVLQLLAEREYIDKHRLALQGQSWGGYQTAYLVTQSHLFACGMAGAPVSNMTSAYGGIRWGSGLNRAFQYEHSQSRIGGSLWQKPLHYIENSPLFYADRVQTPLLIMHNDQDGAVPWYQGIEYFTALRRLEKPAWMLVYNNEQHNLTQRPNRVDLSHRMFGFFNHYLKGAPMPEWMQEGIPAMEKGKHLGY